MAEPSDPGLISDPTEQREFQSQLEELLTWGAKQSWIMLRRPADILLTMDGLGFTHPPTDREPIQIYVNPLVLLEPGGGLLLKGLILHELGHHDAHFSDPVFRQVSLKAKAERLKELLNLLEDEHLERRLRSRRAEWGESLDALASYAFKGSPVELVIESYAELQARDVQTAREDLLTGMLPGEVCVFEWKLRTGGPDGPLWTKPAFVDELFTELEKRLRTPGHLPSDLKPARRTLMADALDLRHQPEGMVEAIESIPALEFDRPDTGGERLARRAIGDLLEQQGSETEDKYLERLRSELSSAIETFPKLGRFVREMERVRGSKWFWNKQRSMLHNLRLGFDFTHVFLPARSMGRSELETAIGKEMLLSPGEEVRRILAEWRPVPFQDLTSPLKVRVSWTEVLASPGTPSLSRFMVSLRLGLGRLGVEGDAAAADALAAVPGNLKSLSVSELWELTKRIADILGRGASDGSSPEDGAAGVLLAESERARRRLGIPLPRSEGLIKEAMEAAVTAAQDAFARWLNDRIREPPRNPGASPPTRDLLNISEDCGFSPIRTVVRPPASPDEYERLLKRVHREVRRLRRYFQVLGSKEVEVWSQARGHRFDSTRAPRLAVMGAPDVLIGREEVLAPDLFIGLAIDCSSSMIAEDRMDKALSFAVLILEATRGVSGITARAVGFTDSTILDAGRPQERRLASFLPSGGNNDSAGLLHLADLAIKSRHRNRLLIMISDGFPTECSLSSLQKLVRTLDRRFGIACAQVAVAPMDEERVAFPEYTDLATLNLPTATALFGRMVQRIVHKRLGI